MTIVSPDTLQIQTWIHNLVHYWLGYRMHTEFDVVANWTWRVYDQQQNCCLRLCFSPYAKIMPDCNRNLIWKNVIKRMSEKDVIKFWDNEIIGVFGNEKGCSRSFSLLLVIYWSWLVLLPRQAKVSWDEIGFAHVLLTSSFRSLAGLFTFCSFSTHWTELKPPRSQQGEEEVWFGLFCLDRRWISIRIYEKNSTRKEQDGSAPLFFGWFDFCKELNCANLNAFLIQILCRRHKFSPSHLQPQAEEAGDNWFIAYFELKTMTITLISRISVVPKSQVFFCVILLKWSADEMDLKTTLIYFLVRTRTPHLPSNNNSRVWILHRYYLWWSFSPLGSI